MLPYWQRSGDTCYEVLVWVILSLLDWTVGVALKWSLVLEVRRRG